MKNSCIFCNILNGVIKSEIIYRNSDIFVIKDISPVSPVHLLIIPTKHITQLDQLDQIVLEDIFKSPSHLDKKFHFTDQGYRLTINIGKNAGQVIDHLHFHLLAGKKLNHLG